MKEIEFLYIVVSIENGEEAIMGFGDENQMQCASTNKALMGWALGSFQKSFPSRTFYLIKFTRELGGLQN